MEHLEEMKNKNSNTDQNNGKELKYEILQEPTEEFNFKYKIVLVGDSSVGKTCLCLKGTKNRFSNDHISTIGFEYYHFYIKINNYIIKLHIWDTCGQEKYGPLLKNFYKDASLVIITYAINE